MKSLLVLILLLIFACSSLLQRKDGYKKAYVASYNYVKETIDIKKVELTL